MPVQASSLSGQPYLPSRSNWKKHFCLRTFLIASIALAKITAIAGVLSVLACKDKLPTMLNSFSHLKSIGIVNSYLVTFGGIALFAIGLVAWGCHFSRKSL